MQEKSFPCCPANCRNLHGINLNGIIAVIFKSINRNLPKAISGDYKDQFAFWHGDTETGRFSLTDQPPGSALL